jgi:hypothetical protein
MEMGKGRGIGRPRQGLGRLGKAPTRCACPKCGYETTKTRGVPCRSIKCPKCGTPLIGK